MKVNGRKLRFRLLQGALWLISVVIVVVMFDTAYSIGAEHRVAAITLIFTGSFTITTAGFIVLTIDELIKGEK